MSRIAILRCWALFLGVCIAVPAWAASEAERIRELERKLEQSLRKIEELNSRLEQLESNSSAARPAASAPASEPAAAAPASPPADEAAAASETVPPSTGTGLILPGGVELHGFADVGFGVAQGNSGDGFWLGSLDFYLTPQLGDRIKSLIELIFEYEGNGDIVLDLERLQLGYVLGDNLTAWIGRFHTPYGYWNTGFHHGQQIQTSISRPRFIDFEDAGGILPAHSVGLWLTGHRSMGPGRLYFDVALANAPRIDLEDGPGSGIINMNNVGQPNQKFGFAGNLAYSWPMGLHLGAHLLTAKVDDSADNSTRLNMLGAYAFFDDDVWEAFAEYYHFNNKDRSGGSGKHNSDAAFIQLGRRIAQWTPYARWERGSYEQADNFFAQQASGRSYRRGVLGVRFDLDPRAALKLEFMSTRQTDAPKEDVDEARFQYSIRF